ATGTPGSDRAMTTPRGWHRITPSLSALDGAGLVEFLRSVFDAAGTYDGGAPAVMTIGDSKVMVSDGGGIREPTSAFLYVYVADADDTYRRAIVASASTIEAPTDTPYGDRPATVKDRSGHTLHIGGYPG